MKYAVAIAPENALPSAFVVLRGFAEGIPLAARLGYEGVELALRNANDIHPAQLTDLLGEHEMKVSAISTGQVFAETGYSLTDPDPDKRKRLFTVFGELIDLASVFGKKVNIGRVRGMLDEKDPGGSLDLFSSAIGELCGYAATRGVDILLEPVNRYELNFINSLEQGARLLESLHIPNLYLMPDLFHMNMEDASIEDAITGNMERIAYVHFADSNRLAPGWGHLDFEAMISLLSALKFEGWIAIEILPEPSPEEAAAQAIRHMKSITKKLM